MIIPHSLVLEKGNFCTLLKCAIKTNPMGTICYFAKNSKIQHFRHTTISILIVWNTKYLQLFDRVHHALLDRVHNALLDRVHHALLDRVHHALLWNTNQHISFTETS